METMTTTATMKNDLSYHHLMASYYVESSGQAFEGLAFPGLEAEGADYGSFRSDYGSAEVAAACHADHAGSGSLH